jgi:hypothetical protein
MREAYFDLKTQEKKLHLRPSHIWELSCRNALWSCGPDYIGPEQGHMSMPISVTTARSFTLHIHSQASFNLFEHFSTTVYNRKLGLLELFLRQEGKYRSNHMRVKTSWELKRAPSLRHYLRAAWYCLCTNSNMGIENIERKLTHSQYNMTLHLVWIP